MNEHERKYERLIAYAAGELAPLEATAVERELAQDAAAAATVARFRRAMTAVRDDRSESPPAAALAAAKALFRPAPAGPSLFDRLRRVLADLVYDSRTQPALVGVRGGGSTYQLTYESGMGEIDVQVETAPGGDAAPRRLIGQVTLNEPAAFGRVVITAPGTEETIASASIDAGGVFSLTTGAGNFDLWIALGDAVIVVPGVDVR